MATLHSVWFDAQDDAGDLDAPALLKAADGSLQEITQQQLQQMIAQLQPGESITVGGMTLTLDGAGQIHISSTRPPEAEPPSEGQSFGKSAGNRFSFGEALQGLWALTTDEL